MSGRRLAPFLLVTAFLATLAVALDSARQPPLGASVPGAIPPPAEPPTPPPSLDLSSGQQVHNLPEKSQIYNGTDRSRNPASYLPGPLAMVQDPGTAPADAGRSILLHPDAIELLDGARWIRRIPFNARRPVGLEEIVNVVADPAWITRDSDGVVLLRAALIQDRGTDLRITRPAVTEVRLASLPGVYLAGLGAIVRVEGVRIQSWLVERGGPDTDHSDGRPFIVYEEGSRLDILHSEIAYLGYDRVSAYGVAWREGGTTGEVLDSDFHHSFFGAYTFEAKDIVFRGNRFHHNLYYGLDPHDFTTGLVVEDNEAWANGKHGFIFSRGVTDGVLRRNYAHHNGGNGIMMDLGSDRNAIVANRSEHNNGDGIVLSESWDVVVADNLVRGNRVGIRSVGESLRNRFRSNRVVDNADGIELYGGTRDAVLEGNVVRGFKGTGLEVDAPGSRVKGGWVQGGSTGVDVGASASIQDLSIREVKRGLIVRDGAVASGRGLTVDARQVAVAADPGGSVKLAASRLRAPQSARAAGVEWGAGMQEQVSQTPPIALAGIGFLAAAVALEVFRRLRDPRTTPGVSPATVGSVT